MNRWNEQMIALRGWRGKLACFIAGAATAVAFAPFYAWPVLFFTLPLLFLMLDKARHPRSAALYAWAFGYGYYMAGTYWIAYALTVDIEQFGWMIPLSVLGLSLLYAIWFALFGALYRWLRTGHTGLDLLRFAMLWVVVEYLRSLGQFGFPWNLISTVTLVSDRVAQLVSILGPYGVGLLVLLLALVPVLWLRNHASREKVTAIALAGLILAYGYGMWRMPDEAAMSPTRVRVVQGNIAQSFKWTQDGRQASARIYQQLSSMKTEGPTPGIIVWPETALPMTVRYYSPWLSRLSELLPPDGLLITGGVHATGEEADYRLYNSVITVNGAGEWKDSYQKHQLVPFGEFVPLRSVLPIEKITPGGIDFSRGEGADTIRLGNVPAFSPLVCYEIIFPWMSVKHSDRPEWIVNVTNDAWYGDTPGPYQHLDAARMRAIEQGIPVVRAANTGVSAVIDPYGRPVRQLALNTRGIIDQALPKSLTITPYAKYAELLTLTLLVSGSVVTQWLLFRRRK